MNLPYFHVLAGFGFSCLQLGHLAMWITVSCFVCLSLKVFYVSRVSSLKSGRLRNMYATTSRSCGSSAFGLRFSLRSIRYFWNSCSIAVSRVSMFWCRRYSSRYSAKSSSHATRFSWFRMR